MTYAKPRRATSRSNIKRRTTRKFDTSNSRRIAKPLQPLTYKFQRSFARELNLGEVIADPFWTWHDNGANLDVVVSLQELAGFANFAALFAQYRLTGITVTFYCPSTNVTLNQPNIGNSQLILYSVPNQTGRPREIDLTEAECLNTQSVSTKLLMNSNGDGVSMYMPLKQLRETYQSTLNSDYAVSTPKFISTDETSTPHYGPSLRMQSVSGGTLSGQTIKYVMTVNFETKQVQ